LEKETSNMSRNILGAWMIFLGFLLGYAPLAVADAGGQSVPVITQSFASPELTPGRTWKVYLKASDPSGRMKAIYAVVDQPGMGNDPITMIRVKKAEQKELSGYIYLDTESPGYPLDFVNLTLTVWIEDTSRNFSKAAVFLLAMNDRYSQEAPPSGFFKNQALGPIMVRLRLPAGGENGSNP
jgi:hypothetical protein